MLEGIIETVQAIVSPEMRQYKQDAAIYDARMRRGGDGGGWERQYYGIDIDELTVAEERDNRNWLVKLAIVGGLTLLPFMPNRLVSDGLKTFSLLGAMTGSIVFFAQEQSQSTRERRRTLYNISELRKSRRNDAAIHQQVFDQQVAKLRAYNRLLMLGEQLPPEQRIALISELELGGYMPPRWMPERSAAATPQFLQEIPQQTLALPGSTIDPVDEASAVYLKALDKHGERRNFFFLGGMGDSKTVSAHFMLWNYLRDGLQLAQKSGGKMQPPVVLVFDEHYGKNNDKNYASTWCGLPMVSSIPKDLTNCVFKGVADDLLPFLDLVYKEFLYRKENDLALDDRPPLLFVIDEFSNIMMSLDSSTQEAIGKILRRMGTESRKFGINYWIIGHSCTAKEIGIDRIVLRGCQAIVGYGILTDSSQMANLPQNVIESGIEEVKYRKSAGQKYAGCATSLHEAPYLPISPLNTVQMQFKWSNSSGSGQPIDVTAAAPVKSSGDENVPLESPQATMLRMRQALINLRQWWKDQEGNPSEENLISVWCELSGEPRSIAAESTSELKGIMGLTENVFRSRMENMKIQAEQMPDG